MYDAIIISDLHLGSKLCQHKLLLQFLENIQERTKILIINGDLVESLNFNKFKKHDWKILKKIKKLSKQLQIIFVRGNHDEPAFIIAEMINSSLYHNYDLLSGNICIHILHGHIFDNFIIEHPIITAIGDWIYLRLQQLDASHKIARRAKKLIKESFDIYQKVINYAKQRNYTIVCCGHTHLPCSIEKDDVLYFNSGSWCEKPCSYLTIKDGIVTLKYYE